MSRLARDNGLGRDFFELADAVRTLPPGAARVEDQDFRHPAFEGMWLSYAVPDRDLLFGSNVPPSSYLAEFVRGSEHWSLDPPRYAVVAANHPREIGTQTVFSNRSYAVLLLPLPSERERASRLLAGLPDLPSHLGGHAQINSIAGSPVSAEPSIVSSAVGLEVSGWAIFDRSCRGPSDIYVVLRRTSPGADEARVVAATKAQRTERLDLVGWFARVRGWHIGARCGFSGRFEAGAVPPGTYETLVLQSEGGVLSVATAGQAITLVIPQEAPLSEFAAKASGGNHAAR